MKKTFFAALLAAFASITLSAQEFGTSYFLDNNLYSYRINPAIPAEKNFAGVIISNVNLSFGSNAGISSYLYPKQGGDGLVTGLHSSVSAEKFLGNLPKDSRLDQVLNENLVAVGFWTKNAFHNIEINVKEDVFAGIPRDLFELAKVGSRSLPYDISATNLSAKSYLEVAYGYTRKISDKWSVGGRAKFLMGLAAGNTLVERGLVTVNGDQLSYDMSAKLRLSSNFISAGYKSEDPSIFDFSAFRLGFDNISPCGWGGAVDLGVTYKPLKGLVISFSAIDLGCIAWTYNIVGVCNGSDTFTGETVKSDGSLKGDLDKFVKNIENLANFKSTGQSETSVDMLSCTLNLGARYYMPFYERLSVGLLASYKIDKFNPSWCARLGATVTPLDWLSITGNYGRNSYCWTYGGAISVNAANLNFVVGYEGYSGVVSDVKVADILSPLATPLGSFQNMLKLGVNVTFGPRHNDFKSVGTSKIHGRKAS